MAFLPVLFMPGFQERFHLNKVFQKHESESHWICTVLVLWTLSPLDTFFLVPRDRSSFRTENAGGTFSWSTMEWNETAQMIASSRSQGINVLNLEGEGKDRIIAYLCMAN